MRMPVIILALATSAALASPGGERRPLVLDDFSRSDGVSTLGPRWQFFTDGVMGGRSSGQASVIDWDGQRCIRLRGKVSLENNGGFIQTRLPLAGRWSSMDASSYTGVRFLARGNGETYAIHLRTAHTMLPWQFYQAEFTAGPRWSEVRIPFSKFRPASLRRPLEPSRLTSVALVAIKKQMIADVAIAQLELYR